MDFPQESEVLDMTLEHYCALFSKLTRAPGPVWTSSTRNRAPHKPLLLLAVMDLVARGVLSSRFISVTVELVELNELFTDYWRSIVPVKQTSSIAFPFSRLHTEPFWKLVPLPGSEITRPIINSISTVSQLRNVALGAEMDEALFLHMSSAGGRKALAAALLGSCFSESGQQAVREQAGDFGEIVYAGMDLVDPKLGLRSMELMAHEVMPRVNDAIRHSMSKEERNSDTNAAAVPA